MKSFWTIIKLAGPKQSSCRFFSLKVEYPETSNKRQHKTIIEIHDSSEIGCTDFVFYFFFKTRTFDFWCWSIFTFLPLLSPSFNMFFGCRYRRAVNTQMDLSVFALIIIIISNTMWAAGWNIRKARQKHNQSTKTTCWKRRKTKSNGFWRIERALTINTCRMWFHYGYVPFIIHMWVLNMNFKIIEENFGRNHIELPNMEQSLVLLLFYKTKIQNLIISLWFPIFKVEQQFIK